MPALLVSAQRTVAPTSIGGSCVGTRNEI